MSDSNAKATGLIAACTDFLSAIENIETTLKGVAGDSQIVQARKDFQAVTDIVLAAQDAGLITPDSFMTDKGGKSYWVGDKAVLTQGHPVPVITDAAGVAVSFNYKSHCRLPVRTVRNAAEKAARSPALTA